MTKKVRNISSLVLTIIAFACLYPGVTFPILTLEIAPTVPFLGKLQLYENTRSILQTVSDLHDAGNDLVASLIFLFSIIVPLTKAILLLVLLAIKPSPLRHHTRKFMETIGKWSMADVFVVGVFLAFLSTRSTDGISAQLHSGFHYFLAYCILSIFATQLMDVGSKPEKGT